MLFPLVLFLIFFLIEFGLVLHVNITVNNSAREAVRYAAVTTGLPGCDDTDGIESIEERAVGHSRNIISCGEVTVYYMHTDAADTGDPFARGDGVAVTIVHEYQFLTPFGQLIGWAMTRDITVAACADGRLENALTLDGQDAVLGNVNEGFDCT